MHALHEKHKIPRKLTLTLNETLLKMLLTLSDTISLLSFCYFPVITGGPLLGSADVLVHFNQ